MRKLYSLVLLATALLIGTNAWAGDYEAGNTADFKTHWAKSSSEDVKITLTSDNISLGTTDVLWLGTASMDATSHTVEIDLNGHVLTTSAKYGFVLTHGTLKFSNSNPGTDPDDIQGKVYHTGSAEAIYVTGSTKKDVDPSQIGVDYFSHLEIGKNVVIEKSLTGGYASVISIDDIYEGAPATSYGVGYYTNVYATGKGVQNKGVANGVRVDVYGKITGPRYGIKANGYLGNVKYFKDERNQGQDIPVAGVAPKYTDSHLDANYKIQPNDDNYSSFVHVHEGAYIHVSDAAPSADAKKPVGVYAAGFGRWLIEGHVDGANGVIVKSGEVTINDAEIVGTGAYAAPTNTDAGNTSSGSAILLVTDDTYAGEINVIVSGTTNASSTNGYAIEEQVVVNGNTEIETINILGGTFVGGKIEEEKDLQGNNIIGAISISETTKVANETTSTTDITITSATIEGNTAVGENGDLQSIIGSGRDSIVVNVDETTGKQTVVVVAPTAAPVVDAFDIDNAGNNADVNLSKATLANKAQKFDSETVFTLNLNQLVMTNPSEEVTLTIKDGHTIIANSVVLGSKAQIIVEPGAALIVKGDEGILSINPSNLVLQANATKQAMFLLNPVATKNAEPAATVDLYTVGNQTSENPWYYTFHVFALPIKESARPDDDYAGAPLYGSETEFTTYVRALNYEQNEWTYLSSWSQLKPFTSYQLANNTVNGGVKYTFEGHLFGNKNRECEFPVQGFGYFGNSHLAPVNIANLMDDFDSDVQKTVWVYNYDNHQYDFFTPDGIIFETKQEIKAMEAFVLYGNVQNGIAPINYQKAVYNPAMGIDPNAAPARNIENGLTNGALISIKAENGMADKVILMEKDSYSNKFENGADASKLMVEDGINLYVATVNGNQSIVADNNIENTMLSFKAGEATEYTLQLGKVFGEDYAIRDNVTGALINCAEGETYTFTQTANTTVSGRFEVIAVAKIATGIENAEAVKSAKGIYTITGQYLGENIEILPAGVYVVNGVKVVK